MYPHGSSYTLDTSERLDMQPQWLQSYTMLLDESKTHILLEGKAGLGKSVFVRYMIIRMLQGSAISNGATFAYIVKDGMNKSRTFWITKTNIDITVNSIADLIGKPDYLLLDSVDSSLLYSGNKMNLGLTSGDQSLKEFNKRVDEAGERGKIDAMHALDLKVMKLIFTTLPFDEMQFRFDVLGGNPRTFCCQAPACVTAETQQLIYPLVLNCITMYFGTTYDHTVYSDHGHLAKWAIVVIARELKQSANCGSSLFRAEFRMADGGKRAFLLPFATCGGRSRLQE